MKLLLHLILFVLPLAGITQNGQSYRKQIKSKRAIQNEQFKNPSISPLPDEAIPQFKGLNYFAPKKKFLIQARLVRTPDSAPFKMPTTTDREPVFEQYGLLEFSIGKQSYQLKVYQSQDDRRNPLRRNQLFLPFKDLTNGSKSYGGGRFIDLRIPKGDKVNIDFNLAYNPFCVYDESYSCPIVPAENHLNVRIPAGEKAFKK